MLTPVDIQQKRFKGGLGYDKKDVNAFFDEVSASYSELYRSNAELKEKVITLKDTVQHYKTTEDALEKNLLLSEKNVEEQKSNAEKQAKAIELEAQSRAEDIIRDAKDSLESMKAQYEDIKAVYAEYKTKFVNLTKDMFQYLEVHDFDQDNLLKSTSFDFSSFGSMDSSNGDASFDFGAFSEDPQMRDSSGLKTDAGVAGQNGTDSSSSNVYGQTLGGEGIDPFKSLREDGESLFEDEVPKSKTNKTPLRTKRQAEEEERKKNGDPFGDDGFEFR